MCARLKWKCVSLDPEQLSYVTFRLFRRGKSFIICTLCISLVGVFKARLSNEQVKLPTTILFQKGSQSIMGKRSKTKAVPRFQIFVV